MPLVLASTVRLGRVAFKPGDEEEFSKVATKEMIASCKERGLLVEVKQVKGVEPAAAPAVKKAPAKKPPADK